MDIFHFRPSKLSKSNLTDLTFTNEDLNGLKFPHDNPLVITALNSNHNIHISLVDTGATSNLMYYSAFKAMDLTENHLTPSSATLVGFSSERIGFLGIVKHSLTLRTTPQ